MTNTTKSTITVTTFAALVGLGYVAFREEPKPSSAIRVDTVATETIAPTGTMGLDPMLATDADLDRYAWADDTPGAFALDAAIQREQARSTQPERSTRTVTLLGQQQAEVRVATLGDGNPALPVPVLDERVRECIGYTLRTSFARARYNLLLQPNLYAVTIRNWSDPKWRETFRVTKSTVTGLDMFPVALWRIRGGVPMFWKFAWVQAGPGLPIGNPQETLSAAFFRGGDVLCVETPRSAIRPLFVAYDQQAGLVVQPQLSVIENASNDSTPMPGAWTTITRFDYNVTLDSAPDESRLVAGDEVYHCPALEAPPAPGGKFQWSAETWTVWSPLVGGRKPALIGGCRLVKTISASAEVQQ